MDERPGLATRALVFYPGNDLLSHPVTRAVPSALEGLTSVFGMGTGVTPLGCPEESRLDKLLVSDGYYLRFFLPRMEEP